MDVTPGRPGVHSLIDGRRLAFHEWGPASGAPVVFFPGAGTSGRFGFGLEALERLNVRLIGIDRPGLGRSDPHPEKTLSSVAEDAAQLLAALSDRPACVAGYSQGAPFALALAASGAVRACAVIAGQDDLQHPAILGQLPEPVAATCRQVLDAPSAVAGMVGGATADWLKDFILASSSAQDAAFYRAPAFDAAFGAALEAGFAQGPDGYVRDFLIAAGRWPFTVEDIGARVDLWYGRQDASPVHSPDLGETLASRLPNARRYVLDEEGARVLWTRGEAILSRLCEARLSHPETRRGSPFSPSERGRR